MSTITPDYPVLSIVESSDQTGQQVTTTNMPSSTSTTTTTIPTVNSTINTNFRPIQSSFLIPAPKNTQQIIQVPVHQNIPVQIPVNSDGRILMTTVTLPVQMMAHLIIPSIQGLLNGENIQLIPSTQSTLFQQQPPPPSQITQSPNQIPHSATSNIQFTTIPIVGTSPTSTTTTTTTTTSSSSHLSNNKRTPPSKDTLKILSETSTIPIQNNATFSNIKSSCNSTATINMSSEINDQTLSEIISQTEKVTETSTFSPEIPLENGNYELVTSAGTFTISSSSNNNSNNDDDDGNSRQMSTPTRNNGSDSSTGDCGESISILGGFSNFSPLQKQTNGNAVPVITPNITMTNVNNNNNNSNTNATIINHPVFQFPTTNVITTNNNNNASPKLQPILQPILPASSMNSSFGAHSLLHQQQHLYHQQLLQQQQQLQQRLQQCIDGNPAVPIAAESIMNVIPEEVDVKPVTKKKLPRLPCVCPNCTGPNPRNNREKKKQHLCHVQGCGKTYGKTSHLRAHLRWHTGDRPFVCHYASCMKRFTRSDELQRHLRTHTGEKRFQCQLCLRKFLRSDHLSKHRLIHLKKAPEGSTTNRKTSSVTQKSHGKRANAEQETQLISSSEQETQKIDSQSSFLNQVDEGVRGHNDEFNIGKEFEKVKEQNIEKLAPLRSSMSVPNLDEFCDFGETNNKYSQHITFSPAESPKVKIDSKSLSSPEYDSDF